jgi:hypothetical protein
MNQLMEMQINDLAVLGEQRAQLLTLTKQQDQAMAEFEKYCRATPLPREPKRKVEIPPPKPATDSTDELYTLMCSLIILAEEVIPDVAPALREIRDESGTPLRERILLILRTVAMQTAKVNTEMQGVVQKSEEANAALQKYQHKCCDLLTLFEEELQFLQTLTHNADLQAAIFNRNGNGTVFGDDEKVELIRHCALMGRFIEETMGVITSEKFEEVFHAPQGIRSTQVFALFQATNLEDKLSNLLSRTTDSTIEIRELFDLLGAQVFINELLKNHASDLHLKIAHYGNEIASLRQELENTASHADEFEDLRQALRHFKRRDSKLRRFLSRYFEVNQETDPYELVKAVVEQITADPPPEAPAAPSERAKGTRKGLQNQEIIGLQQELETAHGIIEQLKVSRQAEIDQHARELQMQLSDVKTKLLQVMQEHETQNQEVVTLRVTIREKDKEFAQQLEEAQSSHLSELKDARAKLAASLAQVETLTQQSREFEGAVINVKKQRQKLGSRIERLETANAKLQESLTTQNIQLKDQYETRIRTLTEEAERVVHERDILLSQIQSLTRKCEQLSSENATLTIAHKSLDLKVRAYEERISFEKRNLQSQAAAQLSAAQIEQSTLVSQLKAQIEEAIHDLSALVAEETAHADLKTVVAAVEASFENAKRSHLLYLDLLDDVSEAQKLLGLAATAKLSRELRELIDRKCAVERQIAELERREKQERQEAEQARKESKKAEQQILALKLWESWGQRVHRVIHSTEPAEVTGKDLRLVLEEALLSSVSHRVVSTRLESLRIQKLLLLKFDGKLLTTKLQIKNGSFRVVMVVCMFAQRIQKFSGHLPLMGLQRVKPAPQIRQSPPRDDTPRKRRSGRSKSVKRSSRSPLRALIPIHL